MCEGRLRRVSASMIAMGADRVMTAARPTADAAPVVKMPFFSPSPE
jgi:hypothetical protein